MPYLQSITTSEDRLLLEWREDGDARFEEVVMSSEFAVVEALGLLETVRPDAWSAVMVGA